MSQRTARRLGVAALVLILAGWGLWHAWGSRAVTRRTSAHIRANLARHALPSDAPPRDRRTLTLLRAFYDKRDHHPAWTGGRGATSQARDLLDILRRADGAGLTPADYATDEIARRLETSERGHLFAPADPAALAELDVLCTIAAFRYAADALDGRIAPRALAAEWHTEPRRDDLLATLQEAVDDGRVRDALVGLEPPHAGYQRLKKARARYAEMVTAGGWPAVPGSSPLRRGDRGPRVAALAARLAVTGELARAEPTETSDTEFDEVIEHAVATFQARHGRYPDGVVGGPELDALNVSATSRLRQIELNMERWRWLPRSFGERYLLVNIPEYMLHAYEGGRQVLAMRVVVGTAYKPTPVFTDAMTSVVVNPMWNVPESIVNEELVPALATDPGTLERKHIRVYAGRTQDAPEIDASTVEWRRVMDAPARYSFRQDPGDGNALGRLKFVLPNQFDVYLHDTPAGHLFRREERSFSHGCIRVEEPVRLAEYVLRGRPEADPETIAQLIASGETKSLTLPESLPIHILYFTAFVDDEGALQFRDDVYGIDRELGAKLAGR